MKRPILFSRLLQFGIILIFFLPFFTVGCNKSEESATAADTTMVADTTLVFDTLQNSKDTLSNKDITSTIDSNALIASKKDLASKKEKGLSMKLVEEHPWLQPFLYTIIDNDTYEGITYTGIALVIDNSEYFHFICMGLAFSILFLCLVVKLIDKEAIITQLFLNAIAILLLYLYIPGWQYKVLWGFWACITFTVLTIAWDSYRLINNRTKKIYE